MQELTRYQCETCKTLYANEEECLRCEAAHVPVSAVADYRYTAINASSDSKYPHAITLLMKDGVRLTYKR